MDETYEGDEYVDADTIEEMSDEELAEYEAYTMREYGPNERDQDEIGPVSEQEIKRDISHHNLIERVENKGQAVDAAEQQYSIETRHAHKPSVEYKDTTVEIDGVTVTGKFPEFESSKDVYLPEDLRFASISKQEHYCNAELQKDVQENPEKYKDVFSQQQLDQISHGHKPEGYTWHHNPEVGRMQLVDAKEHRENSHLGGFALWGGEKR